LVGLGGGGHVRKKWLRHERKHNATERPPLLRLPLLGALLGEHRSPPTREQASELSEEASRAMDGDALGHGGDLLRTVEALRKDVRASELYWSLFATALFHYKVDSLLRPFPPAFLRADGEKDVDGLVRVTLVRASASSPLA